FTKGTERLQRALAKLCAAPFIKVEATKYTEVGYVGRDVESMVRDLMAAGIAMVKAELQQGVKAEAERRAEERVLDLLLPGVGKGEDGAAASSSGATMIAGLPPSVAEGSAQGGHNETRERFRAMLRSGKLDAREVEISVTATKNPAIEIFSGNQAEEMEVALGGLANIFGGKKKKRSVSVKEAGIIFAAEELDKLVDHDKAVEIARERVQETGIIFIDEIDKIANREGRGSGVDVSREGVQRDILPIVEGSTVSTKWGPVDTTHVLFIAAGAFNVSKPQDLIPELQGRFPIRVELDALTVEDFKRILTEPKNALTTQSVLLLGTEGVEIAFTAGAVTRLAEIAAAANSSTENIGARRLQTVMERLLEELSFAAPEMSGTKIPIDEAFVDSRFRDFAERQDLSRYIL
ncbi:MAG: ATP-dependent protease ATPase subunit HslU, partial [Spirochaetota bacterium]